jgi:hypothetical protein
VPIPTNVSDIMDHTNHNTTQYTPTIVNSKVSETASSKLKLFSANNGGSVHNIMDELKMELTKQPNSYSMNKQHKMISIVDSHIRGFTNMLKTLWVRTLNSKSVVKPGYNSSQLLVTARQEIRKQSSDDILVICSGTNDLTTNKSALVFPNISNMVTINNHTNIILVNIPTDMIQQTQPPPMIILRNSMRN